MKGKIYTGIIKIERFNAISYKITEKVLLLASVSLVEKERAERNKCTNLPEDDYEL